MAILIEPKSHLQMDKTWSAKASRPYDPYLTPKGEEQVGGSLHPCSSITSVHHLITWLYPYYQKLQELVWCVHRIELLSVWSFLNSSDLPAYVVWTMAYTSDAKLLIQVVWFSAA